MAAAQETLRQAAPVRLGVNIDHVATLRNARGGSHPDPVRAAHLALAAGADGITAHLREDRRHIGDGDVIRLKRELTLPLNLEMAATEEMLAIALGLVPHACCLVPERREERTTEGGLAVIAQAAQLRPFVERLGAAGIRVSLFIEPDGAAIDAAARLGAAAVELHTGAYCARALNGDAPGVAEELRRLREGARLASAAGLEVHAGHGLTFTTVAPVARIPEIRELNIGHFLVGEAVFLGLVPAIARMKSLIDGARVPAGEDGAPAKGRA
jgi:pyridoxine 5-phosphate synthase